MKSIRIVITCDKGAEINGKFFAEGESTVVKERVAIKLRDQKKAFIIPELALI